MFLSEIRLLKIAQHSKNAREQQPKVHDVYTEYNSLDNN